MTTLPAMSITQPIRVEPEPRATPFDEAIGAILSEFRGALTVLVAYSPGSPDRAVALQKSLGLDAKLCWQVFRLIQSEQPVAEGNNVPGHRSMTRLLAAARRKKVPDSIVERVAAASSRFEEFAKAQGGDRAGFESIIDGLGLGGGEQDLKIRKMSFRANAHTWGIQSQACVNTWVFHRTSDAPEESFDSLLCVGHVGLQRLRAGAPFSINAYLQVADNPAREEVAPGTRETAKRMARNLEVVEEFSTRPLPKMSLLTNQDGSVETELLFPPSGRAGALSLHMKQHVARACSGPQTEWAAQTLLVSPTESLIVELLVPVGDTDSESAAAAIFGRRGRIEHVFECRPVDLLPQRESVSYLGHADAPPPIPGVPLHTEIVRHCLAERGWLGTQYDIYRCRVQYPILHTMLRIAVDVKR